MVQAGKIAPSPAQSLSDNETLNGEWKAAKAGYVGQRPIIPNLKTLNGADKGADDIEELAIGSYVEVKRSAKVSSNICGNRGQCAKFAMAGDGEG